MLEFLSQLVADYRYLALFGVLFIAAMGVPIPEEPVLLAGGLAVGWGKASLVPTLLACIAGVIGGDLYIYCLGRFWGDRFLRSALGRFTFPQRRHERIQALYHKHGNKTVFFGRFIPAVRFGVFFFAGQLRVHPLRFLLLNLAGGFLNIPITVAIGTFAARTFLDAAKARAFAEGLLHEYQFYFFLTLGVTIASIIGIGLWRKRRNNARRNGPITSSREV
jgi:membrane protein DedA with SNARE-associated domain